MKHLKAVFIILLFCVSASASAATVARVVCSATGLWTAPIVQYSDTSNSVYPATTCVSQVANFLNSGYVQLPGTHAVTTEAGSLFGGTAPVEEFWFIHP